jgi:hypothetical protein
MTLKPIRKGEEYTRAAKGSVGFVRDQAPSDGFAWQTAEECGFLSEKELQAAMVDLKMKQRNGRVKR